MWVIAGLLLSLVALPVLRLALFPVRRTIGVPWVPLGVAVALLAALWFGVGQQPAHTDTGATYANADSALRALIE
jgi:hypothetical protein